MLTIRGRTAEFATAVVLLGAVGWMLVLAAALPPSPVKGYPGAAFFPTLALCATGLFLLAWLVALVRRGTVAADTVRFELKDYLVTIAATLGFVFGTEYLGFEVACFATLATLLVPRLKSPVVAVLVAAITMLILYATFVLLLNVSLPLLVLPRFLSF